MLACNTLNNKIKIFPLYHFPKMCSSNKSLAFILSLTVRGKDTHLENLSGFCKTVMQSETLGGASSASKQAILNVPVKMI